MYDRSLATNTRGPNIDHLCPYIAALDFLTEKNSMGKTLHCYRDSKMEFCIGHRVLEDSPISIDSTFGTGWQLHLLALPFVISPWCTTWEPHFYPSMVLLHFWCQITIDVFLGDLCSLVLRSLTLMFLFPCLFSWTLYFIYHKKEGASSVFIAAKAFVRK